MTEFDFNKIIEAAVERLDEDDRERFADAARRINEALEQHLGQMVKAEADDIAADLRTTVSDLTSQTKTLTTSATILNCTLHPVWGQLPRNLYLGLAALLGLVAGAALVVFAATTELYGLQASVGLLESRKAHLTENLHQFEQEAGFGFIQDGGELVISLASGFRIERHVSVRGAFQNGMGNAWRVVGE